MPEIAESQSNSKTQKGIWSTISNCLVTVARIVHFLRIHLVGRTVANAAANDDANVFGKVGTTGAKVAAALTGRKVTRCIYTS
jgi:hypothetical protein